MLTKLYEKENPHIFFVSDTHFGHKNILKYTNRPFDTIEKMDEELILRWNTVVPENGLVYHLGDFALPGNNGKSLRDRFRRYFQELNGQIILIKGNHDRYLFKKFRVGGDFHTRQGYPVCFSKDFCRECVIGDSSGFYHAHMTHKPLHPGLYKKKKQSEFDIFLHGHVHGKPISAPPDYLDLTVDANNFMPVSQEKVIQLLHAKKEIQSNA